MHYAIMKDGIIQNTVVSDGAEVLGFFFPDSDDIIEITDATGPASPGGDVVDGRFRKPQPWPSWVWDEDLWEWRTSVAYPDDGGTYKWDESSGAWVAPTSSES